MCYLFTQQCGSFLTEAEERQPDKRSIPLARSRENPACLEGWGLFKSWVWQSRLAAQDSGGQCRQDTNYLNSQLQVSLTEKQQPHGAKGWYGNTELMWSRFI